MSTVQTYGTFASSPTYDSGVPVQTLIVRLGWFQNGAFSHLPRDEAEKEGPEVGVGEGWWWWWRGKTEGEGGRLTDT